MQNIENNMDELFKKAAAGYPLKTDNSDWDRLASRLLNTPGIPAPVKKKNRFNKYGLPGLLLLFMLVLGGDLLKQRSKQSIARQPLAARSETNMGKETVLKADVLMHPKTSPAQQHARKQLNQPTNQKPANENVTPVNNDLYSNITPDQIPNTGVDQSPGKNLSITINTPYLTYNTNQLPGAHKIATAAALHFKPIDQLPDITNKKTDTIQRSSKLYWGIVFGPGINRVKNQRLEKPGFDIGIMAGISLLKGKASVETGLLYTQKYYFSDGKYFDMDKTGGAMPPGMEVMSLEGSSKLFEVPVKFRYRVLQKNRSGVFLSTGISSYLMTKEKNDYQAMMNGNEENMVGSYDENCRYVAVMANFGAEYNYKIGKHTQIRIEPYIQIPLQGIGIGSMPVMTTGLHFGIMRFKR
jgi:hypothetical protein